MPVSESYLSHHTCTYLAKSGFCSNKNFTVYLFDEVFLFPPVHRKKKKTNIVLVYNESISNQDKMLNSF